MTADKIIILSEFVTQEENSTGYFWSKIVSHLGLKLDQFSVIFPKPPTGAYDLDRPKNASYFTFENKRFNKKLLPARLWGQAKQALGFVSMLRTHVSRNDVILTGTNPILLLLVLPVLRRWIGFRWILLVHDVYPDNMVPAKILKRRSLAYRILDKFFNFSYRNADLIFVIGRDMKRVVSKKTGTVDKIKYIPNWVDGNEVFPLQRDSSEIIRSLGWDDKIVFQFFGNMGRVQGIENLLAGIRLVTDRRAAFLFIGSGARANLVEEFISNHSNLNISYIGEISQSLKNQGLAACDIALVTLEEGMFGLGVPSKAYFSMAAGRPLFAVMDRESEVSLMVAEHNIGWVCNSGDPAAFAKLIGEVCSNFKSTHVSSPRAVFEKFYSERHSLDRLIDEVIKFSTHRSSLGCS